MKNRRTRVLAVIILIVFSLGYLIFAGFKENKVYYTTIKDWKANPEKYAGFRLKIGGIVAPNSVNRQDSEMMLEFLIQQDDETLPVRYKGVVPDTFKDKAEVIVEGRFDKNVFVADNILTKCASKYEGDVFPGEGDVGEAGL